jgi:Kdo2-lipid IVA lauroyltransferase/acyltransferase
MKKIRLFLEYICLVGLGRVIRVLPRRIALAFGRRVGDFIYFCVPIRKKITMEHLRLAFPDLPRHRITEIARKAYQNLALNAVEHLCLSNMTAEEIQRIVKIEGEEILQKALARGKGVIFVGGHFGNWEYMGGTVSSLGYKLAYVVSEIGNHYINRMVNEHRRKMGVEIIKKGASARGIIKSLRNNYGIAMLMDQDAGRSGIFVNFFGRPCSTPPGPALFALKTEAAILFVSPTRQQDGTISASFTDIDVNYDKGMTDENILDITQRCTAMLESQIRIHPDHWLWMHRRWKTKKEQP